MPLLGTRSAFLLFTTTEIVLFSEINVFGIFKLLDPITPAGDILSIAVTCHSEDTDSVTVCSQSHSLRAFSEQKPVCCPLIKSKRQCSGLQAVEERLSVELL